MAFRFGCLTGCRPEFVWPERARAKPARFIQGLYRKSQAAAEAAAPPPASPGTRTAVAALGSVRNSLDRSRAVSGTRLDPGAPLPDRGRSGGGYPRCGVGGRPGRRHSFGRRSPDGNYRRLVCATARAGRPKSDLRKAAAGGERCAAGEDAQRCAGEGLRRSGADGSTTGRLGENSDGGL